jgi:hypothetical protein
VHLSFRKRSILQTNVCCWWKEHPKFVQAEPRTCQWRKSLLGFCFLAYLPQTSNVFAWPDRLLQLDRQSGKHECNGNAERDYSHIFSCFARECKLFHGQKLLLEFVLGAVNSVGDSEILLIGFNSIENYSYQGKESPLADGALSSLSSWRKIWWFGKKSNQLLAPLRWTRVLSLWICTWSDLRKWLHRHPSSK